MLGRVVMVPWSGSAFEESTKFPGFGGRGTKE
jgi:hypothetical protein